jgi:hypothetical protein
MRQRTVNFGLCSIYVLSSLMDLHSGLFHEFPKVELFGHFAAFGLHRRTDVSIELSATVPGRSGAVRMFHCSFDVV